MSCLILAVHTINKWMKVGDNEATECGREAEGGAVARPRNWKAEEQVALML